MTKEEVYQDLYNIIQQKGVDIYENQTLSDQEKLDYIEATLDVMRFIRGKQKELISNQEKKENDDLSR